MVARSRKRPLRICRGWDQTSSVPARQAIPRMNCPGSSAPGLMPHPFKEIPPADLGTDRAVVLETPNPVKIFYWVRDPNEAVAPSTTHAGAIRRT